MMFGSLSRLSPGITLLRLMLLASTFYFSRRLRTNAAPGAGLLKAMTVGMLLTTLLAAQPYHLALTYHLVCSPPGSTGHSGRVA